MLYKTTELTRFPEGKDDIFLTNVQSYPAVQVSLASLNKDQAGSPQVSADGADLGHGGCTKSLHSVQHLQLLMHLRKHRDGRKLRQSVITHFQQDGQKLIILRGKEFACLCKVQFVVVATSVSSKLKGCTITY